LPCLLKNWLLAGMGAALDRAVWQAIATWHHLPMTKKQEHHMVDCYKPGWDRVTWLASNKLIG